MLRALLPLASALVGCSSTATSGLGSDGGVGDAAGCAPTFISYAFEAPRAPVRWGCRSAWVQIHYRWLGPDVPCRVVSEGAFSDLTMSPSIAVGGDGEVFARTGPVALNVVLDSGREEVSGREGEFAHFFGLGCSFTVVQAGPRDAPIEARLTAPCELGNGLGPAVTRARITLRALTIRATRGYGGEDNGFDGGRYCR